MPPLWYRTAELHHRQGGRTSPVPGKKIRNKHLESLFITTGITLVIGSIPDIRDISMMGSAGFLIIFAAVNWGECAVIARDRIDSFYVSPGNRAVPGCNRISDLRDDPERHRRISWSWE